MKQWLLIIGLIVLTATTAIALVALKHQGRQLFIALEQQAREHDRYQEEWSRLQIELAWLGETGRIEQQAGEQLGMRAPAHVGVLVADND